MAEKTKTQKSRKAEQKPGKKHILFVCSEAHPFAGTGGLGEVMGSLPAALNIEQAAKYESSIIMPLYKTVDRGQLEFMFSIYVPVAWRSQYCGLFKTRFNGVDYYFIDNEYYFMRDTLYGQFDDGERFAFFSRAVLEAIPKLGFKPAVLHCQDWQTALVPIYYKLFYMYTQGYSDIKTVFTIHNIEYQGWFDQEIIEDVFGIPASEYSSIEHMGKINLMKGAIDYCDALSTVSPSYAREIKEQGFAHTLEYALRKNDFKLRGILNGINTDVYNPETNPALFKNYGVGSIELKAENKAALQRLLGLPVCADVPLFAVISRLVAHKGMDLIRFTLNDFLKRNIQLVILGTGEPEYESYFLAMQQAYPDKMCVRIAFDRDLSHKIYAGADVFLMPSKSEPCGLSQMMACRYGTIPVVRATGGLKDSIHDCADGNQGNGFIFLGYDAADMMRAVNRAAGLYRDYKEIWYGLVRRAMETDFTWNKSAQEYLRFYGEVLGI